MHYTVILLAAGKGRRMNSDVSKQFILINGKPVIYYSLKAFEKSDIDDIILVTGIDDIEYCKDIIRKYNITKVKAVVPGGKERYDSVWNGIKAAEDCDYILIHDGARVFIDQDTIKRCMDEVRIYEACVAAVPVKDTIKIADDNLYGIETPDRSKLWAVQTPQTFKKEIVYNAYEKLALDVQQGTNPSITDDAMVVEYYCNKASHITYGSYLNNKITTPEDLICAEYILNKID